ncbi:type VI secretion system tip protein VgrG [Tabrizicola sp.]|uniref:type VI secretion system Vgr family protein n=1 Tax=Tabrizicola sp. TaxID=2005166 RepID=UPI001A36C1E6|nr:type VI secretion system tip protein VgrG [Tabrizicola sp.]MBL9072886.1 type VI secretion system tip protein VgrG [Tabrizicola sp.]
MADDRKITVSTALGDKLLFAQMEGFDEISQCFRYEAGLVSKDIDIKPEDILGTPVTIAVRTDSAKRFFHGIVAEFAFHEYREDYAHYRVVLRPWLWFLGNRSDNRIFQKKSVIEIVEEVFKPHAHVKVEKRLKASYPPREYCVQYRESDLDFVQRLMEHEGIFYHFDHADGEHTLVLSDANASVKDAEGFGTVKFRGEIGGVSGQDDVITDFLPRASVRSGAYVHTDYDFKKPATDLMTKSDAPKSHEAAKGELYHYPGDYVEVGAGEPLAAIRLEEAQAPHVRVDAAGTVRGLWSGVSFKLEEFDREADNVKYLVLRSDYEMWDDQYRAGMQRPGEGFGVRLKLQPLSLTFRPERRTPRPLMSGPQTAVVVGPSGEEIFTDEYSRVKVQFHWDRLGGKDENSSCFVRVSSVWAGSGWGFIQIPRIGQEVIVDFLEGNPDAPIITGRVYNAAQMPPYGLPANATQSGWKSNSSPGGGGWNEMRFEDKKGSEEVYFQAEKDHNELVKNNETRTIGNDFAEDVGHDARQDIGHDRTETVGNDKSVTVGHDQTTSIGNNDTESVGVDRSLTVGSNETISIGSNSTETIGMNHTQTVAIAQAITVGAARVDTVGATETRTVGAAQTMTIGASRDVTVGASETHSVGSDDSWTIGGKRTVSVGGDESMTVGGNQTENVSGDVALKVAKGRKTDITDAELVNVGKDMGVKVGKKFILDVTDEITLKCGDAQVTMKKDGTVTIKGKDISFTASGKINAKADGNVNIKGSKINQN